MFNIDRYLPDEIENSIVWNLESYEALHYIINKISKSKLEDNILVLIKAYIQVHDTDHECQICDMEMADGSVISLLYILDTEIKKVIILSFTLSLYIKKLYPNQDILMDSDLTYFAFSRFLYESFVNYTNFDKWGLSFGESYVINLVASILSNNGNNDKKEYNLLNDNNSNQNRKEYIEIVTNCYFFCFKFFQVSTTFLNKIENLMSRTQELDISILSKEQIRDIKDVFHSNRTLYVRIFLVVCNEMIRNKHKFDANWVDFKCTSKDKNSFNLLFNDPLVEMNIWMSSCHVSDY